MINLVQITWVKTWHDTYAELLTGPELRREIKELEEISKALKDGIDIN